MPWGLSSKLKDMHPTKSNDGPILWMRPGEQVYSLTPFFLISPYEFKFRCIKSDLLSSPSRWGWHHTCELAFENHEFEVEFLLQFYVDNFTFVHCILKGSNRLVPWFLFGLKETSSIWKTTNRSDLMHPWVKGLVATWSGMNKALNALVTIPLVLSLTDDPHSRAGQVSREASPGRHQWAAKPEVPSQIHHGTWAANRGSNPGPRRPRGLWARQTDNSGSWYDNILPTPW